MTEISPLETEVQWQPTGDPELPLEARVLGQKWQLRLGDFPAESLWTLIVDGEEVGELNAEDWPACWKNPMDASGAPPSKVKDFFALTNDLAGAHAGWVSRQRKGSGRVELAGKLVSAKLRGVILSGARFSDCDLGDSQIIYADLDDAQLTRCVASHFVADQSKLIGAKIDSCSFPGGEFHLTYFENALIVNSDISRATMDRANFTGAQLRGCKFTGARMVDTRFDGAKVDGSDFSGADLSKENPALVKLGLFAGTQFSNCDFRGANFSDRRLASTRFENCKLAGVVGKPKVEGAYTLVGCDLSQADADKLWK